MADRAVKLFADGALPERVGALVSEYRVEGFTTNPTLMAAAGVEDYERFARHMVEQIGDLPISLEVFADEFDEMERQARILAKFGENVYVKIPITNTRRESSALLVKQLRFQGIKVNVTAVFTESQIRGLLPVLEEPTEIPALVSIFAGRIADAGQDPVRHVARGVQMLAGLEHVEVLWASCREVYNVVQAEDAGCHIVTLPYELIPKVGLLGKDLSQFSLETVEMFHRDAVASGFRL